MDGKHLRDEGTGRAMSTAEALSPGWGTRMSGLLQRFARGRKKPFAMEEFRMWVGRHHKALIPASPNAWGALCAHAIRQGIIVPTGVFRAAVSPATHAHPVRLLVAVRRKK